MKRPCTCTLKIRTAFVPLLSPSNRTENHIPSRRSMRRRDVLRFGATKPARDLTVNVGRRFTPALRDGKARVIVAAVSNDFRGQTESKSFDVDVMITPPRVAADGVQHYINQGGSEMVAFTPGGAWT